MTGIDSLLLRHSVAPRDRKIVDFFSQQSLEIFPQNAPALEIVKSLAKQAQAGLTTSEKRPQKIRQQLCRLAGGDVIEFKPMIANNKGIQVVYLKPIFSRAQPKEINAPFISWVSGSSIFIAIPSSVSEGNYIVREIPQQSESIGKIIDQNLSSLFYFENPAGLPFGTRLAKLSNDPQKIACEIATRAARII